AEGVVRKSDHKGVGEGEAMLASQGSQVQPYVHPLAERDLGTVQVVDLDVRGAAIVGEVDTVVSVRHAIQRLPRERELLAGTRVFAELREVEPDRRDVDRMLADALESLHPQVMAPVVLTEQRRAAVDGEQFHTRVD